MNLGVLAYQPRVRAKLLKNRTALRIVSVAMSVAGPWAGRDTAGVSATLSVNRSRVPSSLIVANGAPSIGCVDSRR